jgi:hypothetical protein
VQRNPDEILVGVGGPRCAEATVLAATLGPVPAISGGSMTPEPYPRPLRIGSAVSRCLAGLLIGLLPVSAGGALPGAGGWWWRDQVPAWLSRGDDRSAMSGDELAGVVFPLSADGRRRVRRWAGPWLPTRYAGPTRPPLASNLCPCPGPTPRSPPRPASRPGEPGPTG